MMNPDEIRLGEAYAIAVVSRSNYGYHSARGVMRGVALRHNANGSTTFRTDSEERVQRRGRAIISLWSVEESRQAEYALVRAERQARIEPYTTQWTVIKDMLEELGIPEPRLSTWQTENAGVEPTVTLILKFGQFVNLINTLYAGARVVPFAKENETLRSNNA